MKSYNNLFDTFISNENILLAIKKASKGKRDRKSVKPYFEHPEEHLEEIKEYATHFYNKTHKPRIINEHGRGKVRMIYVPEFTEQIIHHMLIQVLKPIIMKGMYDHSYGSIPKRGIHKAKKRVELWIDKDRKNTKYYYKIDIKHFYASIPHDRLKEYISNRIRDKRLLGVIFTIIDVISEGLPLGFYTSQWLANWYLQPLDHYIKEKLSVTHAVRYMDDMVGTSSSKRHLHRTLKAIFVYLREKLGLRMKENWSIARFVYKEETIIKNGKEKNRQYGRDIDFMGFRFYRTRTVLRRTIMYRATRLVRHMKGLIGNARRFMSYLGWFTHSDTYSVFTKWITPYVNVRRLKLQIKRFDRKERKAA